MFSVPVLARRDRGSRGPSVFLSEAPTYLEHAGREKVVWLISAILREINHLADKTGWAADGSHRWPPRTRITRQPTSQTTRWVGPSFLSP